MKEERINRSKSRFVVIPSSGKVSFTVDSPLDDYPAFVFCELTAYCQCLEFSLNKIIIKFSPTCPRTSRIALISYFPSSAFGPSKSLQLVASAFLPIVAGFAFAISYSSLSYCFGKALSVRLDIGRG